MEYCIGIDLGGTNIAGGVATLDGRLVHTQSVKTGMPCTPDEIADRIAALCRSLAQAAQTPLEQMAWIGVGAPGSVDKDTGVVEYANNLEFYNVPLGAMLRTRLGLPVYVDNDANAAAWGEYRAGVGKGCSSMVMVTLGTGVGGGIIEDSRIVTGCNWAAGELGHFVIDMNGEPCNCGLRGCFEQYGSVTALIAQTGRRVRESSGGRICALPVRGHHEHRQYLPARGAVRGRRHQPRGRGRNGAGARLRGKIRLCARQRKAAAHCGCQPCRRRRHHRRGAAGYREKITPNSLMRSRSRGSNSSCGFIH